MKWQFLLLGTLFLQPSITSASEIHDPKFVQYVLAEITPISKSSLSVRAKPIPIYCDNDLPQSCRTYSNDEIERRYSQQLKLLQQKLDKWFAQNKPVY